MRRVLLSGVLIGFLAACTSPVAGGLDESQADAVRTALSRAGIDADKDVDVANDGKFVVSVPRDDASRALSVLAAEDLPHPQPAGLESIGKGELVPSADAERAAYAVGLSGELERTLEDVDGVLRARVHLNLPENEPFHDAAETKATASVLITFRAGGAGAAPLSVEAVQRLIAGGAPALAPADVAVVMLPRAARPSSDRDLAHLGPIAVAHGSLRALELLLAGLLAIVAATTTAMLVFYTRSVRLRPRKRA